jgi:hypothetical protein
MRAFLSSLAGRWRDVPVSGAVAFTGMWLITLGVYTLFPPAGLIVGGVLLILAATDMRR